MFQLLHMHRLLFFRYRDPVDVGMLDNASRPLSAKEDDWEKSESYPTRRSRYFECCGGLPVWP